MITSAIFLALLISTAEVTAVQFPSKGKVSLSLGGKNKAEVERVGMVTRARLKMEGIPSPQSTRAGMNCYVVWAVSPEGTIENMGELAINGSEASLEATTRFDRFAILITAEPHYMVEKPGARVVYRNGPSRDFPGVPLTVEVGAYEYADLPTNSTGVPSLVMEARAAIAIATMVQAEMRAESEFRQARVALETMEELLRRASAPDVVSASAHAAIRRAQLAVMAARQSGR